MGEGCSGTLVVTTKVSRAAGETVTEYSGNRIALIMKKDRE